MYSSDKLYTPQNFNELEQNALDNYNNAFSTALTLEQFRHSNIYSVFLNLLQVQLQNEDGLGLLYDRLTSYIKSKQDFEIKPKGSTSAGLYNALRALVDDKDKPLISAINLADVNTYPEAHLNGQASVVLEYQASVANDRLIANCLGTNAPLGIEWLGNVAATWTSEEGLPFIFKWQTWTTINIKVRVHCQYDRNYYGDQLNTIDIINRYYGNFKSLYKPGLDFLPAVLNDISLYPSLRYVNTEVSLDDGETYLPINQVILGIYNVKYAIANKSSDISIIVDV